MPTMLIHTRNDVPEEKGSRLGFIIVVLLVASIVAFICYYFASTTAQANQRTNFSRSLW